MMAVIHLVRSSLPVGHLWCFSSATVTALHCKSQVQCLDPTHGCVCAMFSPERVVPQTSVPGVTHAGDEQSTQESCCQVMLDAP